MKNQITTSGTRNSIRDLQVKYQGVKPPDWIVAGMLRNNRKRPSLLCGLPHAGKSTLARQLAVAVSRGDDFLGRATKKGRVLFWHSEDSEQDALEDFLKQGADIDSDIDVMHSEQGTAGGRQLELAEALTIAEAEGHPFDLVIIETLGDFLQPDDENSNAELRTLLADFSQVVVSKYQRTAFLLIHHFNKATDSSVTNNAILRVSGARAITGKTDAQWFMYSLSDNDPKRIFATKVRKGDDIEPTYLDFDPHTDTSTLGQGLKDVQQTAKQIIKSTKQMEITSRIITLIEESPAIPKSILLRMVGGKTQVVHSYINQLIEEGRIKTMKPAKTIHCFTASQEPTIGACESWGEIEMDVAA
jgi:predicted transcriptional regulator